MNEFDRVRVPSRSPGGLLLAGTLTITTAATIDLVLCFLEDTQLKASSPLSMIIILLLVVFITRNILFRSTQVRDFRCIKIRMRLYSLLDRQTSALFLAQRATKIVCLSFKAPLLPKVSFVLHLRYQLEDEPLLVLIHYKDYVGAQPCQSLHKQLDLVGLNFDAKTHLAL